MPYSFSRLIARCYLPKLVNDKNKRIYPTIRGKCQNVNANYPTINLISTEVQTARLAIDS